MASRQDDESGKRQLGGELIIPLLALGFTIYFVSTVIDSPWSAQLNAYLVGSILVTLVVLFLALAVRDLVTGRANLSASNLFAPYEILPKRLGFIGLTLAYLIAIHWLGFTLTTFAFLLCSMLLLGGGRRPVAYLVSAVIMAAIALLVFVVLFQKRFPKGPVEYLLQAVS
jgi:hypothetical protein